MVTKNSYNTQPAPSGMPDVTQNVKPHQYGEKPTSEKGERKQLCVDLGIELGRWVYKQLKEGEVYHKKHNLNYQEMTVLCDFMYSEIFQQLYADKYPGNGDKK